MKKRSVFSVPPLEEIRKASRIGAETKPSLFESKDLADSDARSGVADGVSREHEKADPAPPRQVQSAPSSAGEASSCQSTATLTAYHPHAIIANAIQVSALCADL